MLPSVAQTRGQVVDAVRCDPQKDWLASRGAYGGRKRYTAGIVDSSGDRGHSGREQLVAGRKHGDARSAVHARVASTERGQDAEVDWAELGPGRENYVADLNVFAGAAHVRAGRDRFGDANAARAVDLDLDLLERNHGIGAVRDHRASHDARGRGCSEAGSRGIAGRDLEGDRHVDRALSGRPGEIGRTDGVAVHRGVIVWRNVQVGVDVVAEDKPQCVEQRDRSRRRWPRRFENSRPRVINGDHGD